MAKAINLGGVNLGAGKAGTLSTHDAPVAVNEDVYVSASKPYTYRLNIALQKRLAAYCERVGRGKGTVVDEAITAWLATHDNA